jgi:hypothetical protein
VASPSYPKSSPSGTSDVISRNKSRFERSGKIVSTPDIIDRIDQAGTWIGGAVREMLREHVQDFGRRMTPFESPIEAIFFAWWAALEIFWTFDPMFQEGPNLRLYAQQEVEIDGQSFRLDFVVKPNGQYEWMRVNEHLYPRIAIELDGHEFHEKTKEQVTYRNKRDRALQQAGWVVFHVSGSELWRDPKKAVEDIHDHCSSEYSKFRRAAIAGVRADV